MGHVWDDIFNPYRAVRYSLAALNGGLQLEDVEPGLVVEEVDVFHGTPMRLLILSPPLHWHRGLWVNTWSEEDRFRRRSLADLGVIPYNHERIWRTGPELWSPCRYIRPFT